MRAWNKIIILLLSLTITTSCDKPNVLTEYSKTDGDDALFLEAQRKMDNFDWDGAIAILTTDLTPAFRATVKAKERLMHAYGGKCGISFFNMIDKMKNINSSKMFDVALKVFDGQQVDLASCDASIAVLHDLGASAASRTGDQNTFAAILGLTRMGVTVKTKMDTESSGLGNGTVDAGWDSCVAASVANRLTDAEIDRVATGVGLIFENIAALGSEIAGTNAGDALDDAAGLCSLPITFPTIGTPQSHGAPMGVTWISLGLPTNTPTYQDFGIPAYMLEPISCVNTVDANVNQITRIVMRRLIASSAAGFGACDVSNINVSMNTAVSPPKIVITSNCCPNLDPP